VILPEAGPVCYTKRISLIPASHTLPQTQHSIEIVRHPAMAADVWRALEEGGHCTMFQSHAWACAWYDSALAAGLAEGCVVLVSDGAGRCIMILPLIRHLEAGRRVIGFADLGVCDYNAPLIAADFAPDRRQMRALWQQIRRALPPFDLILFNKMPAHIGPQANPLLQLCGAGLDGQDCVATKLLKPDGSWLAPGFASKLKERTRKLRARADMRLVPITNDALAHLAIMRDALELRTARPGFHNILAPANWYALYAASLRTDAAGRLFTLEIDGKIEAIAYGLIRGGTFHLIIHTYTSTRWRNYSPGLLLIGQLMQWAMDSGLTLFDFTLGAESYKADFGGEARPLHQYVRVGSLRGIKPCLIARTKAFVRARPRLLAAIRRLRERS
jgi:CelD/BcsL family acetyltransferase involved in cellulose biosynthesis